MPSAKVAVSIEAKLLREVDRWVEAGDYPNRSRAVQDGLLSLRDRRARRRRAPPRARGLTGDGGLQPEIRLPHRFHLPDLARLARDLDLSVAQDVRVVGYGEGQLHVLLDEQHRQALALEAADDLEEVHREERREPERGLVEHEDRRLRHEPARDREP